MLHRGRCGERRSFGETDHIGLLDAAHRQLGGPIVLCSDDLNVRRPVRQLVLDLGEADMTHFHVAAMVVTNTASGRVVTSRQVAIDYPTASLPHPGRTGGRTTSLTANARRYTERNHASKSKH
jgi:hypothetical protein